MGSVEPISKRGRELGDASNWRLARRVGARRAERMAERAGELGRLLDGLFVVGVGAETQ